MLRVMLKPALAARRQLRRMLTTIDIVIDVGVAAIIYVDVPTAPVGIAPGVAPRRAHGDTRAERKHRPSYISGRIIGIGRVGWVRPSAVHHRGIVGRHVNHLRTGRLDPNNFLFDDDGLLFGRLEIARRVRLGPRLGSYPKPFLVR